MDPEGIEKAARYLAETLFVAFDDLNPLSLEEVRQQLGNEGGWVKEDAEGLIASLDLIVNRAFLMSMKVKQAFGL
ncbi:hypothetical protein [Ochrobactrum sp. BTU1]|uniref:hypothetical protein n=1 Tax=Ochrobactrum sp. BTU1 TaxID=2840456 RepID=UPI001C05113E|nr:hypothetical protein KMS41_05025 [Ochrobactrum sp. BTU1]